MNDKQDRMLGMAQKAGKVICGTERVIDCVRKGTAAIVLIGEDASQGTGKRVRDKCSHYNVPIKTFGTMERIGRAIGKGERACVAITDGGFAAFFG